MALHLLLLTAATPTASSFCYSPSSPTSSLCSCSLMRGRRNVRVVAMAAEGEAAGRMNLNEYMVAVDRPLGVRFALAVNGRVFVHSLRKGGNAEKSRIIMVGDTLKKVSNEENGGFVDIKDLGDTEYGTSTVSISS